jgi:hypothetical protein
LPSSGTIAANKTGQLPTGRQLGIAARARHNGAQLLLLKLCRKPEHERMIAFSDPVSG